MKKLILCLLGIMMVAAPVAAEEKSGAKADGKTSASMQPDLRKILEEQAQKESKAWAVSNEHYAKSCLKDVAAGKPVPPEQAVSSTDCYIKAINKHVKPVALNPTMVDDMTGEWKSLARQYGAAQITHKAWMAGMDDTQKKFAHARIAIIKDLIDQAKKQQAQQQAAIAEKKKK